MAPTTVFVVEEDSLTRRGIEVFLTAEGFRVVGAAPTLTDAAHEMLEALPDVLLFDMTTTSVVVTDHLARLGPEGERVRTLAYVRVDQVTAALNAGATGYLLYGCVPEQLPKALRQIANGGRFHDDLSGTVPASTPESGRPLDMLTPREREVVLLLARGMSGAEIAGQLVISPTTVRTHVQNAMEKLHAHTRAQLVGILLSAD